MKFPPASSSKLGDTNSFKPFRAQSQIPVEFPYLSESGDANTKWFSVKTTASWTARWRWRWGIGLRMWTDNRDRLTLVDDPDFVTNFPSIYGTKILTSPWKRPHRRWESRHWQTLARKLWVSGVLQKSVLFWGPLKEKSKADKTERQISHLSRVMTLSCEWLSLSLLLQRKTKRPSSLAH